MRGPDGECASDAGDEGALQKPWCDLGAAAESKEEPFCVVGAAGGSEGSGGAVQWWWGSVCAGAAVCVCMSLVDGGSALLLWLSTSEQ